MAKFDAMLMFTTVVKTSNFSNASQILGITPSAVSKQINLLEKRLGVKLLERTTRSVQTTEAGQAFYDRCCKILQDINEAESFLNHYQNATSGKLRIAISPSIGRRLISESITLFQEQHPNIDFELTLDYFNSDRVRQQFDLAIQLGKNSHSELHSESICRQTVALFAAPSYLNVRGTPLHLHEIKNHSLLTVKDIDFSEPRWIQSFLKQAELNAITPVVCVNDLDLIALLCQQGAGIAALPEMMMQHSFATGAIKKVLPDIKFPARTLTCIYPSNRYLSNRSRVFIEFLKNHFADLNSNLN